MNKYLILVLGIFTFSIFLVPSARASWFIDRTGTLVQVNGMILGDDDENDENLELEQEQEEQGEEEKQERERQRELAKQKLEKEINAREKRQEILKERIKSKIEIRDGKLKVKQEIEDKNGNITKEIETELEEDEDLKVEQENGEILEIKVKNKNQEMELKKEAFHAKTSLPITIGSSNELIIARPDGTEKIVTILPDQAVENMRAKGFVVSEEETELIEESGIPLYKFTVQQEKKLLGLFRFNFRKESKISAETGEEVETTTEGSALTRLLEKLSN